MPDEFLTLLARTKIPPIPKAWDHNPMTLMSAHRRTIWFRHLLRPDGPQSDLLSEFCRRRFSIAPISSSNFGGNCLAVEYRLASFLGSYYLSHTALLGQNRWFTWH